MLSPRSGFRGPLAFLAGLLLFSAALRASTAMLFPPDRWDSDPLPFDFKYGGKDSAAFLSAWKHSREIHPAPGGELETRTFTDPATGLKLTAEVRTFTGYPAVEWVLKFANQGAADTPIIEQIAPLFASVPITAADRTILHYALGSTGQQNDFEPQDQPLDRGRDIWLSSNGRSSENRLPFFDLQVGNGGLIGAIGWSGSWRANFSLDRDGTKVSMLAGMPATHLVLHPGEEIRTPRILLMNWTGDREAAHNRWRQLLLAWYSPRVNGRPLVGPASALTWGNDTAADKIAHIRQWVDHGVPFDIYWIDAGWYGNEDYRPGATVYNTPWPSNRGSWWPNKQNYPDGFKPLSDLLHSHGMKLMVWFEPEEADPGSTLLVQHPGWFLRRSDGGGLLNLGDPEALKGITDIVSNLITAGGIDWYRGDFNIDPSGILNGADTPDRVGMSEIKYVEGLYAFWDGLRARHPGLEVDNCASGGRRIDLETISRSIALWRSDYPCGTLDPIGPQLELQGLAPWVPLCGGCCEGSSDYAVRSAFSPALDIDEGCNILVSRDDPWRKAALDEFHRARPYFYGDYYSLLPYTAGANTWTAIQFDRPDLQGGVAIYLRREESPFTTIDAGLRKIDPGATYSVEIRGSLGPATPKKMTGRELANLAINIPAKPGSVVVFYERQ